MNIGIALGQTVKRLDPRGSHVEAELSDGSTGLWDLVLGADGINSTARGLLFPERELAPRYAGQSIWRIEVERPPRGRDVHGHGASVRRAPTS